MRFTALTAVIFTLTITACSKPLAFEEVPQPAGPPICEGFYQADTPEDKIIPLVSIRVEDGKTYAYSYLASICRGRLSAEFSQAQIAFKTEVSSMTGPESSLAGEACNISAES